MDKILKFRPLCNITYKYSVEPSKLDNFSFFRFTLIFFAALLDNLQSKKKHSIRKYADQSILSTFVSNGQKVSKGQKISRAIDGVLNFSKNKQKITILSILSFRNTQELRIVIFFWVFFGRIEDTMICFRDLWKN